MGSHLMKALKIELTLWSEWQKILYRFFNYDAPMLLNMDMLCSYGSGGRAQSVVS